MVPEQQLSDCMAMVGAIFFQQVSCCWVSPFAQLQPIGRHLYCCNFQLLITNQNIFVLCLKMLKNIFKQSYTTCWWNKFRKQTSKILWLRSRDSIDWRSNCWSQSTGNNKTRWCSVDSEAVVKRTRVLSKAVNSERFWTTFEKPQ